MTILKLFILLISIVHIHQINARRNPIHRKAPPRPILTVHPVQPVHHPESSSAESETLIENKNVNVVVNVDPKEVAAELWKIIVKEHPALKNSAGARVAMQELEETIKPYLTPTRRTEPSAYEVANGLDVITRRALSNQLNKKHDAVDKESLTRTIVGKMMTKLKTIRMKKKNNGQPKAGSPTKPDTELTKTEARDESTKTEGDESANAEADEPIPDGKARRMLGDNYESETKGNYNGDDDLDLLIRIRKGKVVDASLI